MENSVTLSVSSYNQIKAENTKFQMFIDRLFEDAELRADYSGIDFDVRKLEDLIHLVYPDRYKKEAFHTPNTADEDESKEAGVGKQYKWCKSLPVNHKNRVVKNDRIYL